MGNQARNKWKPYDRCPNEERMRRPKMSSDINDRAGLYVEVRNNDVTRAVRKLKKLMNNEGMIKDMRKNEYYEKPSAKKRREKQQARNRWLKLQEKNKDNF